jgi:hypothetical protein
MSNPGMSVAFYLMLLDAMANFILLIVIMLSAFVLNVVMLIMLSSLKN